MPKIIFVDKNDNVIGSGTKEQAWKHGDIHRIARLLVFNDKRELLIHKRSNKLSNLPGKWDQSAAGHVDEGEEYLEAAKRELEEEVGITGVELTEVGRFYQDKIADDGKIKKRFNVLYKAEYNGDVNFDENEVSEVRWIKLDELENWMNDQPRDFTQGFIESYELYKSS